MPRGKPLKNPNGYGSVVKLSGKRRKPLEVRVNTRMDARYYPVYDVLGRFPTREEALIALAEYNENPYSISDREITFSQLYEKFYKNLPCRMILSKKATLPLRPLLSRRMIRRAYRLPPKSCSSFGTKKTSHGWTAY